MNVVNDVSVLQISRRQQHTIAVTDAVEMLDLKLARLDFISFADAQCCDCLAVSVPNH